MIHATGVAGPLDEIGAAGRPRGRIRHYGAFERHTWPGECAERDRVLERLAAALSEIGGHRVRSVAQQNYPAAMKSGRRSGEVGDIGADHVGGGDGVEDLRDRRVPRPEPGAQFIAFIGGACVRRGVGRGVAVDVRVIEGQDREPVTIRAPGVSAGSTGRTGRRAPSRQEV